MGWLYLDLERVPPHSKAKYEELEKVGENDEATPRN